MNEDTSGRRRTRRPGSTRTVPRGIMGGPTAGQSIRYYPLTPDELAQIIADARAQRTAEDIADYATKKRTA